MCYGVPCWDMAAHPQPRMPHCIRNCNVFEGMEKRVFPKTSTRSTPPPLRKAFKARTDGRTTSFSVAHVHFSGACACGLEPPDARARIPDWQFQTDWQLNVRVRGTLVKSKGLAAVLLWRVSQQRITSRFKYWMPPPTHTRARTHTHTYLITNTPARTHHTPKHTHINTETHTHTHASTHGRCTQYTMAQNERI